MIFFRPDPYKDQEFDLSFNKLNTFTLYIHGSHDQSTNNCYYGSGKYMLTDQFTNLKTGLSEYNVVLDRVEVMIEKCVCHICNHHFHSFISSNLYVIGPVRWQQSPETMMNGRLHYLLAVQLDCRGLIRHMDLGQSSQNQISRYSINAWPHTSVGIKLRVI